MPINTPSEQLAGLLNGDLFGGDGTDELRVPITFTSTLRQNPNAEGVPPEFARAARAKSVIALAVNPQTVRFSQPKRFTKIDTMEGSTFFHFGNSKGQNNDILVVSFDGNTGNIDQTSSDGKPVPGAAERLLIWRHLYILTREPMIFGATQNIFQITYTTTLFGGGGSEPASSGLVMYGFFNKVLDFEENADRQNSRDYSFEFTVTSSRPSLDVYLTSLVTGA